MKQVIILLSAAALLLPGAASAQRRYTVRCCKPNPFSFAPYVGAFHDALDISRDNDNTGFLIGFRTGYDLGRRSRLVADIGYGESHDVADNGGSLSFNRYNNDWIMTTGGAEYDIIPGPTSVTFAAQAGAAWRQISLDERVGQPTVEGDIPDESSGYTASFIIVPRVTVRHAFTSHTALDVCVLDHIFTDDQVRHSPALTVGFMFR
jgi:hypothetical protein